MASNAGYAARRWQFWQFERVPAIGSGGYVLPSIVYGFVGPRSVSRYGLKHTGSAPPGPRGDTVLYAVHIW